MSLHHSNRTMSSLETLYKDLDTYVKDFTLNFEEKLPVVPEEEGRTIDSMSSSDSNRRSGTEHFDYSTPKRQCSWQDYKRKRQKDINDAIVMSLHTFKQPSIAFMSEIVKGFIKKIHELCQSRDIFCSTEYPYSFTGEEAVNTLHTVLLCDWPRTEYKRLARSLLHIKPPFITQVTYSERSVNNNTLYDSSSQVYTLITQDIKMPQGLLLPVLDCYSPLCIAGLSNGCYAPYCPNNAKKSRLMLSPRNSIINMDLQRNVSVNSSLASSTDTVVSRAWSTKIPRDILQKTPSKEVKRQEAINEFIYTEEDYVRDLNLLDELFAKPLLTAQCIEEQARRLDVHKQIFGNYLTLIDIHRQLYRELRDYQSYCQETVNGFIDEIGVIVLKYVNQFSDAYISYGSNFIFAEYQVKKEMAQNVLFLNFIREKERNAETRKLPFRHFIILPITRLQRYPLLLEAILKRTEDGHRDKKNLIDTIHRIKDIASKMNKRTKQIEQKLHLKEINDCIRFKPGKPMIDLQLERPERTLIYEGPLKRRKHLGVETTDLYVFLFDHLLLMTKKSTITTTLTKEDNHTTVMDVFTVSKNPIPLNMLTLRAIMSDGSVISTIKSLSLTGSSNSLFDSVLSDNTLRQSTSSLSSSSSTTQVTNHQSSFMIQHLGRSGGEYILTANSPSARLVWREKILFAKTEWNNKQKQIFSVNSMSEFTFTRSSTVNQANNQHGRVNCSARFVGSDGKTVCVIGTQRGIWIGTESTTTPSSSKFKHILNINDVIQLAVLPSHGMLIVLADKILKAYPIMYFDPSSNINIKNNNTNTLVSKVISNNSVYFSTGTCHERTFIITMKKKGTDSHFKAYEPICGDLTNPKNAKYLATKTSFISKAPSWFKLYQTFYIGADSYSIHFLKSKLLVRCTRGFEVIDMSRLNQNINLPDLSKKEYRFILNQPDTPQPLGIFKCNENFLVCYDRFAFMMSTHGDHIRQNYKRMEWEGHPHSVAFYYPYIIAFDTNFIEIRHVETAEIVQIIPGDNIRYLPCATNNANSLSTLYGVMTHPFRAEFYDVFKLVPLF